MGKELNKALFGFDIMDEEELNRHLRTGIFESPFAKIERKYLESKRGSSVGVSINPKDLFDNSDDNELCVSKSVVVRGPEIGDVKTVTMLPNGEIKITHGGL